MDFTVIISDKQPLREKRIWVNRLARDTGYDKSHISRIFSGETKPSLKCLQKLAVALDMTLDDLADALTRRKNRRGNNKRIRRIHAKPKVG